MPFAKDALTGGPLKAAAALAQMRAKAERETPGKAAEKLAREMRASHRLGMAKERLSRPQPRLTSEVFDLRTAHMIYDMQPIARVSLVKAGAPSSLLSSLSRGMDVPKDRLIKILGLSKSTVARKIAGQAAFSVGDSEKIVGLVKLVGQVEKMVMESGRPKGFDSAEWFGRWIEQPESALAGRKPSDLLDSSDGREAVSRLLAQMQSGAYA